jgi:hypothetical protein
VEQKNSKIYNKETMQTLSAYCSANNIEDIDDFIYKCFKQGFDIKKYGLLGKTINEGEKHLKTGGIEEKQVEIEVIREIRVEVPVEVVKYVEVPVEIIKEKIVNVVQEVQVEKPNDKILLLQETLQKLRKELTEKNSRITELEEINKQLESIKVSQGAVFLKGSNISETM